MRTIYQFVLVLIILTCSISQKNNSALKSGKIKIVVNDPEYFNIENRSYEIVNPYSWKSLYNLYENGYSLYVDSVTDGKYDLYESKNYSRRVMSFEFKNNKRVGLWKYYYPNKRLLATVNYIEGEKHGKSNLYNHLGELYMTSDYSEGEIKFAEYFGKKIYTGYYEVNNKYSHNQRLGTIEYKTYRDRLVNLDIYNLKSFYFQETMNVGNYKAQYEMGFDYYNVNYGNYNYRYKSLYPDSTIHVVTIKYDNLFPKQWEKINELDRLINYKNLCALDLDVYTYEKDSVIVNKILNEYDFSKCSELENFQLYCKQINKIPSSIFDITNLKCLSFTHVDLDLIPDEIKQLKNLEVLNLPWANGDVEKLIDLISELPNLKVLNLFGFPSNEIPKNIAKLKGLEEFSYGYMDRYGEVDSLKHPVKSLHLLKKLPNLIYFNTSYLNCKKHQKQLLKDIPNCVVSEFWAGCFIAGTSVKLANGTDKNIEDIAVGDSILCYNEQNNGLAFCSVTQLFKHKNTAGILDVLIHINDSIIKINCTPNHPFYANNKWKRADELKKGNLLVYYNNKKAKIVEVKKSEIEAEFIYNIETEIHNYFANGILVHNK